MADYQRERDFLKSTVDQADEKIAVVEKQQAEEEQGSRADTLELKRLVELLSKGQETNPRVTDARRACCSPQRERCKSMSNCSS